MADSLFPEGYENETVSADARSDASVIGYKPGLKFDYETGDFVNDGVFRIQNADGVESWEGWCKACLMTERYQYLAYNTDFGIDTTAAFKAESREKAEAILTREISEALSADPYGRTLYVEDIVFDWVAPDTVQVTANVRGIDDVSIDVTAQITG